LPRLLLLLPLPPRQQQHQVGGLVRGAEEGRGEAAACARDSSLALLMPLPQLLLKQQHQ
jgi:hypothetical protein